MNKVESIGLMVVVAMRNPLKQGLKPLIDNRSFAASLGSQCEIH